MRFKTHYGNPPTQGQKITQPSKTVPDQAMTINEIMRRYAAGLPLGGGRVPLYGGDEDEIPELEKMELTDRMDAIEAAKQEYAETSSRVKEARKRAKNASKKDASPKEQELPLEKPAGGEAPAPAEQGQG